MATFQIAGPDGAAYEIEASDEHEAMGAYQSMVGSPASTPSGSEGRAPGGSASAAARGLVNGLPVLGPLVLGGIDRADAALRSLTNDTRYSDEVAKGQRWGKATTDEHPIAATAGEIAGGIAGSVPLVMAAPAAFGAGAGGLALRSAAALAGGAGLGAADSAVRSGGDLDAVQYGAATGGALGAVAPGIGRLVGKGVSAITGGRKGEHLLREMVDGLSEAELASAQHIRETSRTLPGGGVGLSVGEALNTATGGKAIRASQLERVAANSGGRGGQIAGEFYAARPAEIDNVGRAAFDGVAPQPFAPTELGFRVQDAARTGVGRTQDGQALSEARSAVSTRVTPEQAGRTIQDELAGVRDLREAARSSRANVDYRLAREAPETVGIERTVTVERPGEPIVTRVEGRPAFTDAAPRPLDPFRAPLGEAAEPRESLARFIARNGGLALTDDVRATDLHRFGVPGAGLVAHEGGKSLDGFWRTKLMEAGYFRPDADGMMQRDISSELLRKLQNEQRGVPSYPIDSRGTVGAERGARWQAQDEYAAALSTFQRRFDEDLVRVGVSPESVHPDIRSRVVGSMMRGEQADPIAAYESTVSGMREPPRPYVKTGTVADEIPAVRFGQVDPRPAMAALAEQGRTAKGDVRGALGSTGRDLREPGGDVDMSVAGLLHARERLDMRIARARELGDHTQVRDLAVTRNALDEQLKRVPEVAAADANFVRNSAPLAPFERPNAPLNRLTARIDQPGREPGPFRMPAEQVPEALAGPTALREMLANGTPAARAAFEGQLTTRLVDAATEAGGGISAERLRAAMRDHADVLDHVPAVRDGLSRLLLAREGLSRVEASPLGRIADRPDVANAIRTLFAGNPLPGSTGEVAGAMRALAQADAGAAGSLARTYLESVFNEATQQTKGIAAQYGGAGFASAVRGNPQQRQNLEAVVRALPDGEVRWTALDRLLTTLEATGHRPQKGSDTAFNAAIQKQLSSGSTPVGQAISDVATGAAAGFGVGGAKGALGGAAVGLKRGVGDAMLRTRMLGNGEAVARLMFDPKAMPDLRALAKSPAGSRNAELFTDRLLVLANGGLAPLRAAPDK